MNKTVILTGATGLIGREAIAPLLAAGFTVYAISSHASAVMPTGVIKIATDLLKKNTLPSLFATIHPKFLLHFAWTTQGDYLTSPLNEQWKQRSLEMLRLFYQHGGQRAVYAGTCFEYKHTNTAIDEADATEPSSLYAQSKHALHQQASQLALEYNKDFAWGRIFYVFGHDGHPEKLVQYVLTSLYNKQKILIKSGDDKLDYMYAPDVANAFVKILCSNFNGAINVCSGKAVSIKKIVRDITEAYDKNYFIDFIKEKTKNPKNIVGKNEKLIQLGFRYQYTLREAIAEIHRRTNENL